MSPLKIESIAGASQPTLSLQGDINEDSVFSQVILSDQKQTMLDLSGVKSINSCGIREWIRWIKATPGSSKLILSHCPKVVIDQINMVDGFLPKGAQVSSFYVPYYCEPCEKLKSVLFSKGKEFVQSKVTPPAQVLCDHCQKPTEMDVIETKYFKFLQAIQG